MRGLALIPVLLICLAAAPTIRHVTAVTTPVPETFSVSGPVDFEHLLRTNPIAAFEASLARLQRDVRGYTCILQKQEFVGGKLGKVEVIRHAVREQPFATTMVWEKNAGGAAAILYAAGENGGRMRVKTNYLLEINADPNGPLARGSSRYSIEDAGIHHGTLRTWRAWKAAKEKGELHTEYLGRKLVPELGRECYAVKRTCNPLAVDNFRMNDTTERDPAKFPLEASASVTVYFDCETWLQIGSYLTRPDGSLMAAYYFRDVNVNPAFAPDQFTTATLK